VERWHAGGQPAGGLSWCIVSGFLAGYVAKWMRDYIEVPVHFGGAKAGADHPAALDARGRPADQRYVHAYGSRHDAAARLASSPHGTNKRTLHGGKQERVELIEVNNGRMTFSVIPTLGMNVFRVRNGDVTLGWTSPVEENVNPSFIDLDSRGGLGWLDGFNEWLARCGFEWAGHPGLDDGKLLAV
jgi:Domain of unknown function (DUF4432)